MSSIHDSDSDVEEIKISDVKGMLELKQKEQVALNKKRDRKKSKKTKQTKKNALLDKYKNEIHQNLDVESKTVLNLIKNKKVKNLEENEDDAYFKDNTYEKDNLVLQILDEKPKFNRVPKEILDFKQKHFFGGRIRRTNLNKILSRK